MATSLKEVVLRSRPGEPIMEDGKEKTDADGKVLRNPPVPITTVEIKSLTAREAMAADDFALAISPTGEPSYDNRVRAYAVCAVRKFNNETIPGAPQDLEEFNKRLDRFRIDELNVLGSAHLLFSAELNEESDPKDSPPAK